LGHNFVDPVPADDNPAGAEAGGSLAIAALASKSLVSTVLPGAFCNEPVQYVEYVSRLVPRASRSINKRVRADDASASTSITKKPRQPGTLPGTQVVGSMLLGEHISLFYLFCCLFACITEYFLSSQMVLWLSCFRARRMRKMMRPSILVGELSLYFCFLAVIF
jgi:hypothetical protein